MRVLVVSAWEPWRRGDGACLLLHAHLRELAPRHDVVLLAAGAPRSRADPPAELGTLPVAARWYGTDLPAPLDAVLRRARRGREPAHVGYVARPALLADLDRTVRTWRPDVLHLFGWGTAELAARTPGLPAVHDAVDPWAANLTNRRTRSRPSLRDAGEPARVRRHEARWYPALSAVVVRTEPDAALLRTQVPGARLQVVPNGVDLPAVQAAPATSGPVLAMLGAYDAAANVEAAASLVTDVLPLVQRTRPDARALLIGRDPPPRLRALAAADVEVTGMVSDVPRALARAAILVAPMSTGYGIKNKVLEAMAAGLPVVASPRALHGIAPSSGLLAAETPGEQAAAVLALLGDPGRLTSAGQANRDTVARAHTWAASARALELVWEDACASAF